MSPRSVPGPRVLAGAGLASARRLAVAGPLGLARMGGSSIAAPDAAGWVTDFLNAAYFARRRDERDPDDLRLAFAVLTTRWYRLGRRLRLRDVAAFHRAFGGARLRAAGARHSPTLTRDEVLEGAARLLGPGFPAGYADDARRGWGIVFADPAERSAYAPERRLARGALRELSPPRRPAAEQRWHTYRPVPLPSAEAAMDLLSEPSRWPDFGSELGRFTAVRGGGLAGQTFEIEIAAAPAPRLPVLTRGYVTATRVLAAGADRQELEAWLAALRGQMRCVSGEVPGGSEPVPPGARLVLAAELTTHAGHFLGRAISRIIVFERDGGAFVRDVGSWDPPPVHLAVPYRLGGHAAQRAFWGDGRPEESMLHQLARVSRA